MKHVTHRLTLENGPKGHRMLPFIIREEMPFGFPFKEQQLAIVEREFPMKPEQSIVCSERGELLIFSRKEIIGGYVRYTHLKSVFNPGPKPLW